MKTTDPKSAAFTLMCRLRRHVITTEGDFVPAGTPVKVMGWRGNDTNGSGATGEPMIEVRTAAYMYADTFDYETGAAAVGCGLYLSVEPDNLVYDEISEDYWRNDR